VGSFLFTNSAELVGLVIEYGVDRVIVPGSLLLEVADELLRRPQPPSGAIGVEVQMLTEPISLATGASTGVVVTWIEPGGPADGLLTVGDVIEALQGRSITNLQDWNVPVARLAADEKLNLLVRHRQKIRDVTLVAAGTVVNASSRSLGLTLENRTRAGTEVIRVEHASAGDHAGLMAGDLIVLAGEIEKPTPAQVNRAFGSLSPGQHLLVAVRRGTTHLVTAIQR
jgi:S1-C subfamily serine protease